MGHGWMQRAQVKQSVTATVLDVVVGGAQDTEGVA